MKIFQCVKLINFLVFVLLPIYLLPGQIGFNFYNQRNHPELSWQVIETARFKIIYHQRLEKLAINAANISESCLQTLTANLQHTPSKKIPIYLSDQDEIANGFDVSNRYIVIWVNANRYVEHTTGMDKWLRKVIAHELVHYLHFSKISTGLGFVGHAFTKTPRWFIEGLAQYESETWNIHRGDLILRTRVLEDEMDYASFNTPTDGKMLYASGNSAVRYLAQKYGDSTLVALLAHRNRFILPYYDFNQAFKHVLNKTPAVFLKEWRKHVNIYYHSVYAQKEELDDFARKIDLPFQYISDFKISPDSTRLAVVGIVSMNEPVSKLYLLDSVQRRIIKILEHNSVLAGIDFSPESRFLTYAKYHRGKNGALIPDILVTDLFGKKHWVTQNLRARMPVWSQDGEKIICIINENGTDNFWSFSSESAAGYALTHFTGDCQLSTPSLSPNGKWLAFMRADSAGQRNLMALSLTNFKLWDVTRDSVDQRNPAWSPDSRRLAFTAYQTGIPNIFCKNLDANNPSLWRTTPAKQITDAALGIYALTWQQDSLTALILESKNSRQVYRIPANRQVQETKIMIKPRYTAWKHHRPPFGIPEFQQKAAAQIVKKYHYNSFQEINHYFTIPLPLVDKNRTGFSFISYWAEPLGKHQFLGFGDVALNKLSRSRYILSYLNNQWHPNLALSVFYFPLEAQLFADELLVVEKQGVNLTAWLPFNFGNDLFSNHGITASFSLFRNHPQDLPVFESKPTIPESHRIGEFSIGYRWKYKAPHRWNIIHPLKTKGLKLQAKFSDKKWKSQLVYQQYELDAYANQALPWLSHVFYTRLLVQAVQGNLPQQNQIGFDKYDQLDFGLGLPLGDRPRLRGVSEYYFGNRVIFGTLEYRFPLIRNLGWYLAGLSLGKVTGCGFLDFGSAWDSKDTMLRKVSFLRTAGFEIKNTIGLGFFSLVHELGWARKLNNSPGDSEIYYRIRSVVPF